MSVYRTIGPLVRVSAGHFESAFYPEFFKKLPIMHVYFISDQSILVVLAL